MKRNKTVIIVLAAILLLLHAQNSSAQTESIGDFNGFGTYAYGNGNIYRGNFKDGFPSGHGTMIWNKGETYTGDWVKGVVNGLGTYHDQVGNQSTGRFENSVLIERIEYANWTKEKVVKTMITNARSLKTLSSLMGTTFESSQAVLKSNGMAVLEQGKDEVNGFDYYYFVDPSTNPELEPAYALILSANKVISVMVTYEYDLTSDEYYDETPAEETPFIRDMQQMVDQLASAGFVFNVIRSEGDSKIFTNSSKSYDIEMVVDDEMGYFDIRIGNEAFLNLIMD